MKTISTSATITGVRSKVDGSLGVTVGTPELSPKEKALFMELHGVSCNMTLKPIDEPTEEYKLDREIEKKTPSQRMRNVLYVYWKQLGNPEGYFDTFYRKEMDKIIDNIKSKLE